MPKDQEQEMIALGQDVLKKEAHALEQLSEQLNSSFIKALEAMSNVKGRVIVTGMGKSGHIGNKIAATLSSTGTPAFFVHPGEASHGDLGMILEDDVIIAISNSGESKELSDVLAYCKKLNIPIIAVTSNPKSFLAKAGDILLLLPQVPEACPLGMAPTTSTTLTLALGDALAACLLKLKGLSKDDYKKWHPGGKLGASLLHAKDIMHTGEELPLVKEDDTIIDALMIITRPVRFGCVGVVDGKGNLTGIVTDGDLCRCMPDSLFGRTVKQIMKPDPKTVSSDFAGTSIIELLNTYAIKSVFVVENDKPVGIIEFHDLLKAGIVS